MYWAAGSGTAAIVAGPEGEIVQIYWTATAAGIATLHLADPLGGYLWKVVTQPVTITASYSLQLLDEAGMDVLYDACDSRSTSAVQTAWIYDSTSTQSAAVERLGGYYIFKVTGAGNADKGVAYIHLRRN